MVRLVWLAGQLTGHAPRPRVEGRLTSHQGCEHMQCGSRVAGHLQSTGAPRGLKQSPLGGEHCRKLLASQGCPFAKDQVLSLGLGPARVPRPLLAPSCPHRNRKENSFHGTVPLVLSPEKAEWAVHFKGQVLQGTMCVIQHRH